MHISLFLDPLSSGIMPRSIILFTCSKAADTASGTSSPFASLAAMAAGHNTISFFSVSFLTTPDLYSPNLQGIEKLAPTTKPGFAQRSRSYVGFSCGPHSTYSSVVVCSSSSRNSCLMTTYSGPRWRRAIPMSWISGMPRGCGTGAPASSRSARASSTDVQRTVACGRMSVRNCVMASLCDAGSRSSSMSTTQVHSLFESIFESIWIATGSRTAPVGKG